MFRPDATRSAADRQLPWEAFARGLLAPDQPTPPGVTGPAGKGAEKRYNVYRNNVTVSLIEALAAIFPAVRRITGPDFFRAMARAHVRRSPPVSPLLFDYGRDFPAFIEAYDHARGMPWLADTARIERAWLDAYHAADAPALRPEDLAGTGAEALGTLVFTAHPAARIVRSPHPALSIFAMNRGDGPIGPITCIAPEDCLITRPDMEVIVRHLPPGAATFLGSLMDGAAFGIAVDKALADEPAFDLAGALQGMIEAGAFTSVANEAAR